MAVAFETGGYPGLAEHVASHLARVGRLELGRLAVAGDAPPPDREVPSDREAAYWRGAIEVPDAAAVAGRVVLLVVDATRSQWAVAVAAAKLREAGAAMVLPLVIHRQV